jgi:hypothetical protein
MYKIDNKYSSQSVGFRGMVLDRISVKTRDGKSHSAYILGTVADIQLKWLCAVGALSEPTDEAFNDAITHYCPE